MTPEFAKAVDPVFLHVLDLLDRIDGDDEVNVQEERVRIRSRLERAEASLGASADWQVAKYALVAWVDEVLIDAPWSSNVWWKENSLEWEQYNTLERSEKFYVQAKEASALRGKDALEVFYVAVVLGFRGLYRDKERAKAIHGAIGAPADLESWAKQTAMAIQLGKGLPPIGEASRTIEGAPPLDGTFALIWAAFAGLILSVLCVIVGVLFFG